VLPSRARLTPPQWPSPRCKATSMPTMQSRCVRFALTLLSSNFTDTKKLTLSSDGLPCQAHCHSLCSLWAPRPFLMPCWVVQLSLITCQIISMLLSSNTTWTCSTLSLRQNWLLWLRSWLNFSKLQPKRLVFGLRTTFVGPRHEASVLSKLAVKPGDKKKRSLFGCENLI